ncbi:MAG: GNAT family N-acetyltransferase [Tenericutes bacterium]|nr:GNAT family N-acetyltransferase [Mycoplasmatota bacterium]
MIPLKYKHIDQCIQLWQVLIDKEQFIYSPINKEQFISKFLESTNNYQIISFVYLDGQQVIGWASGTIDLLNHKSYITMIMVDPEYQRRKIGTKLVSMLESKIKEFSNDFKTINILFFNPVQLNWIIPNTKSDDHPNAPGVDIESSAFSFFQTLGYQEFARQNVYYKNIRSYTYTVETKNLIEQLKNQNIMITQYQKNQHTGLNELFQNLNNPYWEKEINQASQNNEPILVAVKDKIVIGFTGPLRVQASGRGYFAGIGVHDGYRGHGIGKVLFASLCKSLSAIGAEFMSLFTGENNPARKIYEKEDFQIVKRFANMKKEIK